VVNGLPKAKQKKISKIFVAPWRRNFSSLQEIASANRQLDLEP
jgi:hypothetical protein